MSSRSKRRKKRKAFNHRQTVEKHKKKGAMDDTSRLTPDKFQSRSSGFADEINRLISKYKIKAAVSRAKFHHKRLGTAESEMVLVDAYVARIREMGPLEDGRAGEQRHTGDRSRSSGHGRRTRFLAKGPPGERSVAA